MDRARGLLAEHDELVGDFAGTGSGRGRRPLSIGSTEHAATGLGLALLLIASEIPEVLRELHGLPSAGWIGVHLVSREALPDTITHTAAMLSSFLTTTTGTARAPMVTARRLS